MFVLPLLFPCFLDFDGSLVVAAAVVIFLGLSFPAEEGLRVQRRRHHEKLVVGPIAALETEFCDHY